MPEPFIDVNERVTRVVSIGSKFAAATMAVILLVATGIYVALSGYQRESLLHAKEMAASAVTRLFADSCAAPVEFEDETALRQALATVGRDGDIEYAAVWPVDGGGTIGAMLGELPRGAPEPARTVPASVALERRPDRVVVLSPVRNESKHTVGVVAVAFSLSRENAAIADVRAKTLLVSAAVAAGLSALLLAMARHMVVGPLSKLVVAVRMVEEGKAGDVDVRSNDEIGLLAEAFRSMATAIRTREERITAQNRDMRMVLDNVGQGFVTLDVEGKMSEQHSRIIREWFGAPERGTTFWQYLQKVDPVVAQWFELGWTAIREDIMPLEVSLMQLPQVVRKNGQTFEFSYRPILKEGQLEQAIVVTTDVTSRIERERAEQAQREMMSIFHRIRADRQAFEGFFFEASELVRALEHSTGSDADLVMRQLHTLKGNCSLYGIESVATFCHELEDRLKETTEPLGSPEKAKLSELWAQVSDVRARLGEGDNIEIAREEYDNFLDHLRCRTDHNVLAATCSSWKFEPAAKRLALLGDQITRLVDRMGKAETDIVCHPTQLRLPPSKWGRFWSAFAHIIRNAVDHGIETSEDRQIAGKSVRARIELAVTRESDHVLVTIRDDGAGIDWPTIAEKAKAQGLPWETRGDLEEALFAQGMSVRSEASSSSGRGVGLSAVREIVRELKGDVEVQSQLGGGTMFRFVLPNTMLFEDVN
jgi:signal transduction histidine kinase